jgi:hypothetical protein
LRTRFGSADILNVKRNRDAYEGTPDFTTLTLASKGMYDANLLMKQREQWGPGYILSDPEQVAWLVSKMMTPLFEVILPSYQELAKLHDP